MPIDPKDPPNLELLIKLMRLTTSSTDAEALMAIRKANEQVSKFGGDWDTILRGKVKVTVIGDPFKNLSTPAGFKPAPSHNAGFHAGNTVGPGAPPPPPPPPSGPLHWHNQPPPPPPRSPPRPRRPKPQPKPQPQPAQQFATNIKAARRRNVTIDDLI